MRSQHYLCIAVFESADETPKIIVFILNICQVAVSYFSSSNEKRSRGRKNWNILAGYEQDNYLTGQNSPSPFWGGRSFYTWLVYGKRIAVMFAVILVITDWKAKSDLRLYL